MKKKTFVCVLLIFYIALLSLIASVMIYIDPLFQYHERLSGHQYPIINEGYQNPGIVKTFPYNALVTGSSMMQNNDMQWYSEYISQDIQAVKVTYSSATAVNIGMILETALKANDGLRNAYIGCDVNLWGRRGASYELPDYLYDQRWFNDANYVWNKTLLFEYTMPVLLHTTGLSKNTNMSEAYWWAQDDSADVKEVKEKYQEALFESTDMRAEYLGYVDELRSNMEHYIIPLIDAYPNTTFHFIFPPYHMISWKVLERRNVEDIILEAEEYLLLTLSAYDNVKIHFFSTDEEIIYDFENYLDSAHYKAAINEYMVMSIGKEDHLLRREDVAETVERLRNLIDAYDYHAVFAIDGNMW